MSQKQISQLFIQFKFVLHSLTILNPWKFNNEHGEMQNSAKERRDQKLKNIFRLNLPNKQLGRYSLRNAQKFLRLTKTVFSFLSLMKGVHCVRFTLSITSQTFKLIPLKLLQAFRRSLYISNNIFSKTLSFYFKGNL